MAIAFALLLCVGAFGLAGAINQFAIVDAVNAKLSSEDQFSQFGWYLPKTLRLHSEYRRLYPDGTLLRRQGILAMLSLSCGILAAALLDFGFVLVLWFAGFGLLMIWFAYFRK